MNSVLSTNEAAEELGFKAGEPAFLIW